MKKVFFVLGMILSTMILTSCATLPKKVKEGDTLIIGQITCSLSGYDNYEKGKPKGLSKDKIEAKVLDVNTNKEYNVVPDKDGFFFLKNLPAHHACVISYIKVTRTDPNGSGYYVTFEVPASQRKVMIPYSDAVVNAGTYKYYFDGKRNWVTWENTGNSAVNVHFKQMNEDSEWFEKKMYDQ